MTHSLRILVLAAALASAPGGAHAADPVLMLLLGFVQNRINTLSAEKPAPAPKASAPAPRLAPKPIGEMQIDDLRLVVDESFGYLSRSQRNELVTGLDRVLADPANAPHRLSIIMQFLQIAQQVRHAHDTLDRLSPEQKRLVATQFTRNFRELAPEQQSALSEQLRQRALPVPADLSEMMLTELAGRR
jgi:hypothetical protein